MDALDLASNSVISSTRLYVAGMSYNDVHFCGLDCLTKFIQFIQKSSTGVNDG
jgi:hypothetical protein